ncbi:hypothetical protein K5D42_25240 [Pseudomonas cichorii]|nr:hypothetical protein [Pseudomonas cichorii]MBX8493179.1 hypothetical protein [Pseudomonas cichorii]
MTIEDEIRSVIESVSTSHWLRQTLSTALQRDCVDAANDAEQLSDLLGRRCTALLTAATAGIVRENSGHD